VTKRGEYGKTGRRITSPVTTIPTHRLPEVDAPQPRVHEASDGIRLTRGQTWGLAIFVAASLSAFGTVSYFGFSRAAALDHQRDQIRDLEQRNEKLEDKVQRLERQQVLLQTKIENM